MGHAFFLFSFTPRVSESSFSAERRRHTYALPPHIPRVTDVPLQHQQQTTGLNFYKPGGVSVFQGDGSPRVQFSDLSPPGLLSRLACREEARTILRFGECWHFVFSRYCSNHDRPNYMSTKSKHANRICPLAHTYTRLPQFKDRGEATPTSPRVGVLVELPQS